MYFLALKYDFFGEKRQKNHNFSVSKILEVQYSILFYTVKSFEISGYDIYSIRYFQGWLRLGTYLCQQKIAHGSSFIQPGARAQRARAITGRRCLHSGEGEDFLMGQLNFFTKTAVTPERKVEKSIPRWKINRHAED